MFNKSKFHFNHSYKDLIAMNTTQHGEPGIRRGEPVSFILIQQDIQQLY